MVTDVIYDVEFVRLCYPVAVEVVLFAEDESTRVWWTQRPRPGPLWRAPSIYLLYMIRQIINRVDPFC